MIPVQIRLLDPAAKIPEYATPGAAAIDLRAMLDRPYWLHPGEQMRVQTGIAIYIGDPAYCAKIYPRSGLGATHGLILGNGTGLIDSDYQGEIMVCLWNRSEEAYHVLPGERIAQMTFESVEHARFEEVAEFVASERGAGGFGHSGRL